MKNYQRFLKICLPAGFALAAICLAHAQHEMTITHVVQGLGNNPPIPVSLDGIANRLFNRLPIIRS